VFLFIGGGEITPDIYLKTLHKVANKKMVVLNKTSTTIKFMAFYKLLTAVILNLF